ncbi:putative nuclease HARBI1 [Ischnura elegans]|uniref:putative nuclease HARBI1 n=1 Tax=Ischnura elegans TaxID=197161 RepID=UPI001ED8BAD3|nr:putative nuclease HARBI1 [Ischnura elegans]XP_046399646.1 putative nuclease HARBI1 [Ischnura elegans]
MNREAFVSLVFALKTGMAALQPMLNALAAEVEENEEAAVMRSLRDRSNAFDLSDERFRRYFRLSKDAARYLCNAIRETFRRQRSHALSVEIQVLAALRFFAVGSYQRAVGQERFISMSQPAISRAVRKVSKAITEKLGSEWVKFPINEEQRNTIKRRFRQTRQMKGVVGCMDCTHIAIIRPKQNEEAYLNHKGYHSLNVLAVCSHDLEFLAVVSRYPGSVHDSFIWRHSTIRDRMIENWDAGDHSSWLLGDSGFPLEPWLMTPIVNAEEGTPEARYTEAHCRTRNCIERAFGVLKNTFRCLLQHRTLHYNPAHAACIVLACCILHNIRIRFNIQDTPIHGDIAGDEGNVEAAEQPAVEQGDRLPEGVRIRNLLVRGFRN